MQYIYFQGYERILYIFQRILSNDEEKENKTRERLLYYCTVTCQWLSQFSLLPPTWRVFLMLRTQIYRDIYISLDLTRNDIAQNVSWCHLALIGEFMDGNEYQ